MKQLTVAIIAMLTCCSMKTIAQISQVPVKKQVASNEVKPIKNTVVTRPVLLNTAYDFSNVKICVDQPEQTVSLPARRNNAGNPIPQINADGSLSQVAVTQQALVGATEKMWNPGDVIKVWISEASGSPQNWASVKYYAKQWEAYANIKFEFVTSSSNAQIRVGFFKTGQSWSWIGRDVLNNPFKEYTMNFGWADKNTNDVSARTILHEFGHALGFHHEHQSPVSPLQWNLDKTYKYFKEKNNWDAAAVDRNIIQKYSKNNTNYSAYDRYSIMHYEIPEELLLSGSGTIASNIISGTDGQYAGYWYPFPPKGKNTTGNLRTNDDCDDVAFKVEYDVVAPDKVEFTLSLGERDNKKVTWWKQIKIPMTNNTETALWVQNHSLIASENRPVLTIQVPEAEINREKGISFWKAKLLGIHTLLEYKWNLLPAIKGGCRVTLTWNKDSCL